MTRGYGPEIQGGWARADVVIDDDQIEFPYLIQPDYLIAFSQNEFERDRDSLKEGGTILATDLVKLDPEDTHNSYSIPVVRIAEEELGRKVIANIIMLGAFARITGIVPMEAMESAVEMNVPKGTEALNLKAFRRGYEYAKELYDPALGEGQI